MVAASQRGRQQDGSFSPLTLSVSLCTTLYSLSLSCLWLSLLFFSICFSVCFGLLGQWFFFFFFKIYMGFGLADSVGWFRIFGGGPKLKRKGRPKSSSSFFFFFFFFWENLLTIYIYFFFWCPDRARAPQAPTWVHTCRKSTSTRHHNPSKYQHKLKSMKTKPK